MNYTGGKFWLLIAVLALLGASLWIVRDADELHAASNSRLSGVSTAGAPRHESVRAELVRLQEQTGLTVAWYEDALSMVSFKNRSVIHGKNLFHSSLLLVGAVSRDGIEIAVLSPGLSVMRSDGSDHRRFGEITTYNICWSYDTSKLAMTRFQVVPYASLEILELRSGLTTVVNSRVDEYDHLTSQCWSPDDKKIVYETEGNVQIYEVGKDKSSIRVLAKGKDATWSPDGNWIAFLDHDTYYAIRPDGQGRKKLFHKKGAGSGLFWSPDSRIVAYASRLEFLEGAFPKETILEDDLFRLRVRRLQDNSEDWVVDRALPGAAYQWVSGTKTAPQ
ncbi:MAG: TolB family protein [Candidatus Acidiferrales bacterium]